MNSVCSAIARLSYVKKLRRLRYVIPLGLFRNCLTNPSVCIFQKQIDLLEDAEEAFMLNMGDVPSFSKLLVGETFVNVSDEEGQAFVESELEVSII